MYEYLQSAGPFKKKKEIISKTFFSSLFLGWHISMLYYHADMLPF